MWTHSPYEAKMPSDLQATFCTLPRSVRRPKRQVLNIERSDDKVFPYPIHAYHQYERTKCRSKTNPAMMSRTARDPSSIPTTSLDPLGLKETLLTAAPVDMDEICR